MTIDEILKNEPISVRSYNVCKYNGLETLKEIIEFYRKNRSFNKLRNCGKRSNEELTELYSKYKNIDFGFKVNFQFKIENKFKIIISELSRNQREVINSFIQVKTNSLSIRSQNAIKALLGNNLKIKNFADEILFTDNFDVKKIKNIGAGSASELEAYIYIVENFIIEVSKNENDKYLISLKNKFLIQNTFSISNIPNEILESESIFQLTNFLLKQNAFYDKNQTKILTKTLKIYLNSPELTLDEIAKEVGLTRERVRQIRKTFFEELSSKLLFIQNFDDNLLEKYNIDNKHSFIDINENQIEAINNTIIVVETILETSINDNNTGFTKSFITYLLYSFWSNDYELVGNIEDVLQHQYFNARNRHNWNNFYLVKKELVQEFDFISFANDISERLNERLEETYSFSFKSYLFNFLINDNLEILNSILEIAEKMVNQEFEIYIDLEDNLIFERNSVKTLPEYIFDALEELGKPSTVDEIYNFIENKNPGTSKSSEALRGSCQRSESLIFFGRSSTYGLKKWEAEMDNIKGGTIRNIVNEFLSNFDNPMHISEIANHVLRFRPKSNEHSILQNIKLDESGLFLFFTGSRIGLSNKTYDSRFSLISQKAKNEIKTWEESFLLLTEFIKNENRLPFSSGCSDEEIQLYRWYNIQKGRIDKGKLDITKENLINAITNQFDTSKKRKPLNISDKYKELLGFIFNQKRLPSVNKAGEENLYHFFYKKRKLFESNDLEEKEKLIFIEIAKTIQTF